MRKSTRFFIFLVKWFFLAILAVLIFQFFILKPLVSSSLGLYWDTDVEIQKIRWDGSLPGFVMDQVKVGNPYGFPRGDMLQIDRIAMRFDLQKGFFLNGALKPDLLEVQIKKIELMRRVSGHLNFQLFVHPENLPSKRRGLGLAPIQTKIIVAAVSETDASQPLLKRQDYILQDKEFVLGERSNFRILTQAFVAKLFQRIGLSAEGNMPALPAPQYHGVAASVEQEIKEHSEKIARDEAAAAKFEELSLSANEPQPLLDPGSRSG